jgi:hypothetical protein
MAYAADLFLLYPAQKDILADCTVNLYGCRNKDTLSFITLYNDYCIFKYRSCLIF